jgi:hypothetical protein
VNAHLNSEVERLTLAVDTLEKEKAAYERHIKDLAKKLAALRLQLPEAAEAAARAEEQADVQDAEDEAAAHVLQSDVFACGAAAADDGGGDGVQGWLQNAAWLRFQGAGQRAGWLVDPAEVVLGEVIGRGTFGVVHRATWRGGVCAVKRVTPHSQEQATTFVREVEALALLRHPHVMQLYAACARPPHDFWLICELLGWVACWTRTAGRCHRFGVRHLFPTRQMSASGPMPGLPAVLLHLAACHPLVYRSGGTLATWLYGPAGARRLPSRSLSERLKMALDVARGMQALEGHTPQILHRDLKPSNVVGAPSSWPGSCRLQQALLIAESERLAGGCPLICAHRVLCLAVHRQHRQLQDC